LNGKKLLKKGRSLDDIHAEQIRLRVESLDKKMIKLKAQARITSSKTDKRTLMREWQKC
jgi:hypothetical protein